MSLKVVENLYRIKGPAAKAYLWLLIRQKGNTRYTRAEFRVSDAELAQGPRISRPTAKEYRESLQASDLVVTDMKTASRTNQIPITGVKY